MSYFLYAWFAHFVYILEQVNQEILGRHGTHTRPRCHAKTTLIRGYTGTKHQ